MEINDEGLLLNIGHKSEGIVPTREMRSFTKVDFDTLEEGSEVVALVINPEDDDGATILSVDKARGERGWRVLEKAKEEDKAVDGVIIGSNRGGAVVKLKMFKVLYLYLNLLVLLENYLSLKKMPKMVSLV